MSAPHAPRPPGRAAALACAAGGAGRRAGLTLIELLTVVAIVALLLAALAPSLRSARQYAAQTACASNLRQLGVALHMYAADSGGWAMPAAHVADWPMTYWWGTDTPAGVDHTRGFTWPYLRSELAADSVYECPAQPPGTYQIYQGVSGQATSTYGYNGYFLSPAQTPGWSYTIGHRRWQNLDTLVRPQRVFAFADAMIDWGGQAKNAVLLDPPQLFQSGAWSDNPNPTTSFRHRGRAVAVHVDGHADAHAPGLGRLTSPALQIGYVGPGNGPHYVPDWATWIKK